MEAWLTTFEAARMSGYELDYIRKLIRAGKIARSKWGQSWLVHPKSLLQFLRQMDTQGKNGARNQFTLSPDNSSFN